MTLRLLPVESTPADSPQPKPARDPGLPPVEPPTAGFLLQLFLIPMVIVSIIVLVWFAFSWLAHQGVDPHDLARSLKSRNDASWQKAYNLSNMLRDSKNAELKRDRELARELIDVLEAELGVKLGEGDASQDSSARDYQTDARVRLREFLCRSLGEFELTDVAPTLVKALQQEQSPLDLPVRRRAAEALAVLAGSVDLAQDGEVVEGLIEASRDRSANPEEKLLRGELRSAAAFALGMVGSPAALDQLEIMLTDVYANARFNAATGLARQGDARCVDTLVAMLDPDNAEAVADEESEEGQRFKRAELLGNGIKSVRKYLQASPEADMTSLRAALQKLADANLSRDVTMAAKETVMLIQQRD
ncbi:MAG: HEAT repeat domain-containing protein [Planctomycetales bacterium]|nr:HEAT repeat domain-containing protein [Planctomycetales bacterium]